MAGRYLLALDQGTSSSRALLFDLDGRLRALALAPLRQIFPQPGWVEHAPAEIAATGVAKQRETTVLRDRWRLARRFDPQLDSGLRNSRRATWKRAAGRATGWEPPD